MAVEGGGVPDADGDSRPDASVIVRGVLVLQGHREQQPDENAQLDSSGIEVVPGILGIVVTEHT